MSIESTFKEQLITALRARPVPEDQIEAELELIRSDAVKVMREEFLALVVDEVGDYTKGTGTFEEAMQGAYAVLKVIDDGYYVIPCGAPSEAERPFHDISGELSEMYFDQVNS